MNLRLKFDNLPHQSFKEYQQTFLPNIVRIIAPKKILKGWSFDYSKLQQMQFTFIDIKKLGALKLHYWIVKA